MLESIGSYPDSDIQVECRPHSRYRRLQWMHRRECRQSCHNRLSAAKLDYNWVEPRNRDHTWNWCKIGPAIWTLVGLLVRLSSRTQCSKRCDSLSSFVHTCNWIVDALFQTRNVIIPLPSWQPIVSDMRMARSVGARSAESAIKNGDTTNRKCWLCKQQQQQTWYQLWFSDLWPIVCIRLTAHQSPIEIIIK
jgi:hypothetical protein